ncbi:recombinase family protein [Amycolatopsis sp. cg5]|uniref:recombinase family protein n=1 Tax=Amycolatopsis sp. cg5 TaxID=3238802 RepID=UPI003525361B
MSATAPRKRRKFKKQVSERPEVVPFTPEDDAALCYTRQSHFTDESTSNATQTRDTNRWCNAWELPIVKTVQDLHVSGDLEPHKRAGLAEWLTDAPPKPWKTLVVPKLDRLVRNVMDALTLLEWLRARGKRLISIAEGIDSSNSMSEFMITLMTAFARMERERMKERFRSARATLKDEGRWAGEGHPYGTMPVELPARGGFILGLDPYAVKFLHTLSKKAREGAGLSVLGEWLKSNKVVTPRNRQAQLAAERRGEDVSTVELTDAEWSPASIRRVLENPDLVDLGIFEPAEQAEISARLEEKASRKTRGSNQPYGLSGVLVCPDCLDPLWHRIGSQTRTRKDGSTKEYEYRYWRCPTRKHGPSLRADEIEPLAEEVFLKAFANVPVRERIVLPPTSHANEIAKLEREHARQMTKVAREKDVDERRKITAAGDKILADIDLLRSLPADPGGVQWVPTDRTWKEELAGMSTEDRRLRWLELGFSFAAKRRPDGSLAAGWRLPDGWRDAMPEVAAWQDRAGMTGDVIDMASVLDRPTAAPAEPGHED